MSAPRLTRPARGREAGAGGGRGRRPACPARPARAGAGRRPPVHA